MRLNNFVSWHAGESFKGVDVLRKAHTEQRLVRKNFHKRVRECRAIFPRENLFRQDID
jgi:hypothetical protein